MKTIIKILTKFLTVIRFICCISSLILMIVALCMAFNQNIDAVGFMMFSMFMLGMGFLAEYTKKNLK